MEVTHTEKAYCCSNYPQTEATLIAKFELVLGALGLLTTIIIISLVASTDALSQAAAPNQNVTNNDLTMFFSWTKARQYVMLSLGIVGKLVGIAFSILLYLGVTQKNHLYLLLWFIFTIGSVAFSVLYGIGALILATDKLLLSTLFVTSFLYNWYCLWIVKLLMSEIRAVHEGYSKPLDDGEIEHASNLIPPSDSFTVDKF